MEIISSKLQTANDSPFSGEEKQSNQISSMSIRLNSATPPPFRGACVSSHSSVASGGSSSAMGGTCPRLGVWGGGRSLNCFAQGRFVVPADQSVPWGMGNLGLSQKINKQKKPETSQLRRKRKSRNTWRVKKSALGVTFPTNPSWKKKSAKTPRSVPPPPGTTAMVRAARPP